jgi:hypothetical protein
MPHPLLPDVWPILASLETAMPALSPDRPNPALAAQVIDIDQGLLTRFPAASRDQLGCVQAGMWLLADDLDRAHTICQEIPSALGSAWHAVMHRREGDFSNSLYWWRRAGAVHWADPLDGTSLLDAVRQTLAASVAAEAKVFAVGGVYDPAALVRAAERAPAAGAWAETLAALQRWEWLSLFTTAVAEAGR